MNNVLQANLGRCKNGLTKWSRDNFPNFRADIAALNLELDSIQDASTIDRVRDDKTRPRNLPQIPKTGPVGPTVGEITPKFQHNFP